MTDNHAHESDGGPEEAEIADESSRHPLAQHSASWWLKFALILGAIAVVGLVMLPGVLFAVGLIVEAVVSLIKGESPTM